MKKSIVSMALLLVCTGVLHAQSYRITLQPQTTTTETKVYLAQHFRDKYNVVDSATYDGKQFVLQGNHQPARGIYALLNSKKAKMFDFVIDDSYNFTISYDEKYSDAGMKVKGSKACQSMFDYMAKMAYGRDRSKELSTLAKTDKTEADKQQQALGQEMEKYIDNYKRDHARELFTIIMHKTESITVPDTLPAGSTETRLDYWQASYYRAHYWDNVDLKDHSLIYTPQLFDKMNYYFFGVLYYQDVDTIERYAFRLLDGLVGDSTMLRYVLDFITPRYERSTKMVGWDQVFVDIVERYYLSGKCPWATQADLYNKKNTIAYLKPSLIGHHGAEIMMPDSNQSDNPTDWISSHYFPERYVILWFWDPDCHHCQEQSEELKKLYNKMIAEGNKRFEVYAIGYEADVPKWKRYMVQHEFPWVNVGGSNVNIDYQAAYNVHGAPTMIILNADRDIIMNKTLSASALNTFLDQYEQQHPDMATKVTPFMRRQPNLSKH